VELAADSSVVLACSFISDNSCSAFVLPEKLLRIISVLVLAFSVILLHVFFIQKITLPCHQLPTFEAKISLFSSSDKISVMLSPTPSTKPSKIAFKIAVANPSSSLYFSGALR
jgi:hypothetical protein